MKRSGACRPRSQRPRFGDYEQIFLNRHEVLFANHYAEWIWDRYLETFGLE